MKNPAPKDGANDKVQTTKGENKVPSEEELQKGLAMLEAYKNKMQAYTREAEMLANSIRDHARALDTLDALKGMDKPTEMMVPIGAGVFIFVKPARTSKVLMNIGSGVSAEYKLDPTIEKVQKATGDLEAQEKVVVTDLSKIEQTVEVLSQKLQAMYESIQKGG